MYNKGCTHRIQRYTQSWRRSETSSRCRKNKRLQVVPSTVYRFPSYPAGKIKLYKWRKLDRPWPSPSGIALGHFRDYLFVSPSAEAQAWGFVILEPDPPAFRISKLGGRVRVFRHFLFQYGIKLWFSCVRLFIGVKYSQMFIQIRIPRGLEIIAR